MKRIGLASILLLAAAVSAAQSAGESKEIHARGCVQAGVEAHCLVVKDATTGKVYNLLLHGDRPQAGIGIAFTATPFRGMTSCMEGAPVSVTQWSRDEQLQCAASEEPRQ